ncbi:MAG: hypothetical protein AAGC78_09245 [Cellvibrio sp.]|uniref:hypothetical protein n=1 Tax=Cellvibrio sp. TaxID=1965322 RepID=UPI0031AE23BF
MSVKRFYTKRFLSIPIFLVCLNPANANEIKGSLTATSLVSDNTLKKPVDPIEERQNLYQAGLMADYSNWLVDADASYQWNAQEFTENSQDDERYVDGRSRVNFGKKDDPAALELSHSRRMLLVTPDAVGLTSNQQEREIISVLPELRKRIFNADVVTLGAQLVQVNFPDNDLQDSEREGFSLGWVHPLSRTSLLQAFVQQQNIKFENYPLADYRLSASMLAYAVELRKLRYRIELGYNESGPDDGIKQTAPAYKVIATYESGYNQVDITLGRELTDTSFGNGNLDNNVTLPGSDGMSLDINRIDRVDAELKWETSGICMRCAFALSVSANQDEYLEKDEKSVSIYTNGRFVYSFSSAAKVSLSGARSEQDFKNEIVAKDYTLNYVSLEYSYQFLNGLSIRLVGRNEDRKTTSERAEGTYQENIYSIGLGYKF